MILLDPMYDGDIGEGVGVVIVLKDRKEIEAFRLLAEVGIRELNKQSTAYKLAKRFAEALVT